jgi:UPF0176 protein
MSEIAVAAFYRFAPLDPVARREPLRALCAAHGILGTVLLAPEGVNATLAGSRAALEDVLAHIRAWPGFAPLEAKWSSAPEPPFGRLKVRLKREIVSLGQPQADPARAVGTYVAPADWNDLIGREDVVLIDTRNAYEVAVGSFPGAVDPGTRSFRAFPDWWRANADRFQGKRVAMFCTGGIRCEKATSWLLGQGLDEVLHLQGGILKYLEEVPPEENLWQGECFVFDGRVALGQGLAPAGLGLCHACRRPVAAEDRAHPAFEEGVACPACIDEYGPQDRDRFRERQRQVALAARRERKHIGTAGAPL